MTIHYTNELIFDLPEPLIDQTNHIYSLSEEGPSDFNMVISRFSIEKDETLDSYGTKLLGDMNNTIPKFHLLSQGNMKIADQDAIWFIYTMVHDGKRLYQTNVNFLHEKNAGSYQVIQIAATSRGNFTEDWKKKFENFLDSVKFRQAMQKD